MRGDVNAIELYQDRKFLEQVGLGILDIPFGSGGGVGFEDVHRFSYLEAEEEDPKLYRRRVFKLTGCYYPNDLAQALWQNFNQYQMLKSQQAGQEISLEECAKEWIAQYGHDFFKSWALHQSEVPFRMRNRAELKLGWLDLTIRSLVPDWRWLLEAGFSPSLIAWHTVLLRFRGEKGDLHFVRLVARLSGLPIKDKAEAERRLREIRQLAKFLSEQNGDSCSLEAATIEYYRRLNLVAEIEGKRLATQQVQAAY